MDPREAGGHSQHNLHKTMTNFLYKLQEQYYFFFSKYNLHLHALEIKHSKIRDLRT